MRVILFLCGILLSSLAHSQSVRVFKKNKKVGVEIPSEGGTERKKSKQTILLKANYDGYRKIDGGWVLYKEKAKQKVDAVLVMRTTGKTKNLGKILTINNHFIRYEYDGYEHLYNINTHQDQFTNKESVIVLSTMKQGKNTWYFIVSNENKCSFYCDNNRVFELNGTHKSNDIMSELILLSNGQLIDFEGKQILTNVQQIDRFTPNFSGNTSRLFLAKLKDGQQAMLNFKKVIIPPSIREFSKSCINENRIIQKDETGYNVYNSQGKKLNKSPFQDILRFKRKSEDFNVAKLNDQWSIINERLEVVKTLPFASVEEVDDNYFLDYRFYKVKTQESDELFFILDEEGKKVFEEPVASIQVPETEEPIIIAQKDKLYNIGNQYGNSGFLFDKVNVITDFYSYNQHSFEVLKQGKKAIYWAQDVHQLFYEDAAIDKIERLALHEEEMFSNIWLLHKDNKIAIAKQDFDQKKFVLLTDFNLDNAQVIEDYDFYESAILELKDGNKVGWFNPFTLDTLIPMEYEEIVKDYDMWDIQSSLKVKKNGLWGLVLIKNGKKVIPPLFEWIGIDNDYIQVRTSSGKYGMFHYQSDRLFIDTIYKNMIGYDEINSMERIENAQEAEINGRSCMCILQNGDKQVCYDRIEPVLQGERYKVYKEGKVGLVSNYNEFLIPLKFDKIEYQKGDDYFVKVYANDSIYLTEPHGSSVYAGPFNTVDFQKKQKAYLVVKNGKKGVFAEGEVIIPVLFDEIIWKPDFIFVKKDDFWGAYDIYYVELSKPKYNTQEELIQAIENQ